MEERATGAASSTKRLRQAGGGRSGGKASHREEEEAAGKPDENRPKRARLMSSSSTPTAAAAPLRRRTSSSAASKGKKKKKMVIRPFKVAPRPPEAFEETTFSRLRAAVQAIHRKEAAQESREELYRGVESLCIHKRADEVYRRLEEQCDAHVRGVVASLTQQTADSVEFLALVDAAWRDHCDQMLTVRSVFLYLDRTYVIQSARARSLWDLGLDLFRRHLAASKEVQGKAVRAALDLVSRERQGENVPRALLRDTARMFSSLRAYGEVLERPLLAATAEFYDAEGSRLAESLSVPDYLAHCNRRVLEENERVTAYLDESTRSPLVATVEAPLIRKHAAALLAKGFDGLMRAARREDLARMYLLLSRVGELDAMRAALRAYTLSAGREIVKPGDGDRTLVERLLAFKAGLDALLEGAFAGNAAFAATVKSAFEDFVNSRSERPEPAELIARFLHAKLRAGSKNMSRDDLERLLDRVMELFRFIHGKDVFEAFYKKHLATRLLLGRSADRDAEVSMITKLKAECGTSFTKKLEGMFADMDRSAEIMAGFGQHDAAAGAGEGNSSSSSSSAAVAAAAAVAPAPTPGPARRLELSVRVLTTGCWPDYPGTELRLPPEVEKRLQQFKQYYLAKYGTRKLSWEHSLSTCVLGANFPCRRHELSVSAQQAAVLLLFNGRDEMTFKELEKATGMEGATLARTMTSLVHGQVPALLQEPRGRRIRSTDRFRYNAGFRHKLFRITINQVQAKETKKEQKETQDRVFVDRQYAVDATIVRVMKSRKTLSHQLLMAEVISQSKFQVDVKTIKGRIASLIEREYLERDTSNNAVYNYMS